jgi:hypothetical protein
MSFKILPSSILILLSIILIHLPKSVGVWITYKQFIGYIPSYTYKINLNAGDTLHGQLSWPGT